MDTPNIRWSLIKDIGNDSRQLMTILMKMWLVVVCLRERCKEV